MKYILLAGILLFSIQSPAQPIDPGLFLSYSIGTRFTPHHKVTDYFTQEAKLNPDKVRMIKYGVTNEDRPLFVVLVSTAETMKNIDAFQSGHLKNTGYAGAVPGSFKEDKCILWLSYNVHGNEASGTEAALTTYYRIMSDPDFDKRMKDIILIIDPCLNPDGRERYINWFRSVSGSAPDINLWSREHQEPWPGGRSNHYYFDLNRDWAWQTQVESEARMKLYNDWMPHVHVDFHEQSINNPYYFAPAAEPYHEVITPFQREFQKKIGASLSKKFDEKGWLYFTRERFDLFYPSYGDTYPMYTGAIGMTYEQAGGRSAGTAVKTLDETLLTLRDRVEHHTVTGLSTLEVVSANTQEIIGEFIRYYKEPLHNAVSDKKFYSITFGQNDKERARSLISLLNKNRIQYNLYKSADEYSSLQIPLNQSRSRLVKVLFEPSSFLKDSLTYDITAWNLPYVFGLHARLETSGGIRIQTEDSHRLAPLDPAYAYVFRWQGGNSARALSYLLKQGIKVRFAEKEFKIDGRKFDPGTMVILKNSGPDNAAVTAAMDSVRNKFDIDIYTMSSGMVEEGYDTGSEMVRPVKAPRIVLFCGEGTSSLAVGEVWFHIDKELAYPVSLVNTEDFNRIRWPETDVVIMPEGGYNFLKDNQKAAGLENWIRQGGKLIAMEGAIDELTSQKWITIKKRENPKDTTDKNVYRHLKKYSERERDYLSQTSPGAIYKVDLDNSHPLAFGYPDFYYSLKQGSTFYEYFKGNGWNVGTIKAEPQPVGFVGSRMLPQFRNALIFGVQELGRGQIVFLGDDVLFRNFWENGKLMFDNALFLSGQ